MDIQETVLLFGVNPYFSVNTEKLLIIFKTSVKHRVLMESHFSKRFEFIPYSVHILIIRF